MAESVLPTSLQPFPHWVALEKMLIHELERKDYHKLLVYLFDTVDESFLDYLAEQFNMLGYNGWNLAETVEQKRDLLKRAVQIKKTLGTPYSIKQAAIALGVKGPIQIEEGISFQYNGEFRYDGSMQFGEGSWALFTVRFSRDDNPDMTDARIEEFKKMVEVFKPARSRLLAVYLA